jgi:hypothetical protein
MLAHNQQAPQSPRPARAACISSRRKRGAKRSFGGYRKAVRGSFLAVHGFESLRNPTPEEWAELSASCEMRDMGTHLCALPTGDHCPRGLVCLGCGHAQPKRSAAPVFARMAQSHKRELTKARKRGEPAGQIAARELEVERITSALRRARELQGDVAEAIEARAP